MTDKDLKTYFQQRLAGIQTDDVPAFEDLFAADALVSQPKKNNLWLRFTAVASVAAAAAVALLLIFRPTPQTEDVMVAEGTETILQETAPQALSESDTEVLVAEAQPLVEARSLATSVVEPVATEIVETVAATTETANKAEVEEENEPAETPAAVEPAAVGPAVAEPAYERSIEQAYEQARHEKKQARTGRRASYGLRFAHQNDLLASANLDAASSITPVNSVTNRYGISPLRSARSRNDWKTPSNLSASQIRSYAPVYHYPISLGLSVQLPLTNRLAIHSGLDYTCLFAQTNGSREDASSWTLNQVLHYVGVPLDLVWTALDRSNWRLYTSLGGGLEKALCGVQYSTVYTPDNKKLSSETTTQPVYGVQPYVAASLGVAYRLASRWQLYLEPGLHYYFDADQPLSVRTKNPLILNIGAGIRFDI